MLIRKHSIGLVLSGGSVRGLTHIGILRVLECEGIPVDYLAGTSMGGLIAAGYAVGMIHQRVPKLIYENVKSAMDELGLVLQRKTSRTYPQG